MFKNMCKRAWLSVIRKPSRTIILTAILFIMANMMLATIAINTSVEKSVQYAKESMSGTIYLQPDMEKIGNRARENATPGTPVRISTPSIPLSIVEGLADSEYLKDYTYSISARANASGFTPVETEELQMMNQIRNQQPRGGGDSSFHGPSGDISVVGINSYAFIPQVESNTMRLDSGEIFDETTDQSIIISRDLAEQNNLSVGDSLTLATTEEAPKEISLKIIGIYYLTQEDGPSSNTIYMNPETAQQFMSTTDDTDSGVRSVRFFLSNAEDKEAFLAEAAKKFPNLADDDLTLDIDDSTYQQMVGPIESVGSFATLILWVVIVAAIAIITLIITINVKDRRYEMGVLLSLGASKKNILGQILLELIVVGTIGFILSVGTSTFLARALGSSLLDNQVKMNEQQSQQNYGRGDSAMRGGGMVRRIGGPGAFGPNGRANVEPIKEIDVTPALSDYIILFATGYLIIIVSLIIPSVNILRYQPKTILTGKE